MKKNLVIIIVICMLASMVSLLGIICKYFFYGDSSMGIFDHICYSIFGAGLITAFTCGILLMRKS